MRPRTSRAAWAGIAAGSVALAAAACAPKAAHRQTDIMEKTGAVSVSAATLRARVNDLADRLVGRVEETADRIRAESRDRAVRRRALSAKIDSLPAVYTAAFRADPLVAAIDVWTLTFQGVQFTDEGAGREVYGAQQPLARDTAHRMLAEADELIRGIAVSPEAFARARSRVEQWATAHPVEHNFLSRPSFATEMAKMRSERDAFVAVGAVTDTVENLSERLNTYAALLPKQARWQAELLLEDTTTEPEVEGALGDVHALGLAARHANDILGDVPGLVGAAGSPVREAVAAERRAMLEDLNRQRLQTLEYTTAERLAVLAAMREERIATLDFLHQERVEGLKEVDAIKTRGVESAVRGLQAVVDYTLWRLAALLLFAMVSAAGLGVVAYNLSIGRQARA